MILLVPIAFVAGLITAFTPCILPVLPIVLAGGTNRRPLAIVAGLVSTFTLFTLAGAWIFSSLGLSARWQTRVAVAFLLLLAVTLAVPRVGLWLERPFAFMTRRSGRDLGGGFLLGASLGLVFTPCAGPVFAAVSVNAGTHRVGFSTVVVAVAYAIGAALPLLLIAYGGRGIAARFRANAPAVRYVAAAAIAAAAVVIGQGWATGLQTKVPGYADAIQKAVEGNGAAKKRLAKLEGRNGATKLERAAETAKLSDFGPAPTFTDISSWLNTPGDRPLTLTGLRGRVVLVDFWTYSCVNCLRTLPHLEAWDRAYRKDGLTIVGVHTPEFAFEHVRSNVSDAVRKLGVRYPVALDNGYGTWNAYANQYWPAEYLIDRNGHVRHVHFGEGEYGQTEMAIRTLLAEPGQRLGPMAAVPDRTPRDLTTPESYLGSERLDRFAGGRIVPGVKTVYRFPKTLPQNDLAYAGEWTVQPQRIVAGRAARLRLHFVAKHVYLVLGGTGELGVLVNGKPVRAVHVRGFSRLYELLSFPAVREGILELRFAPGLSAYAFTFG